MTRRKQNEITFIRAFYNNGSDIEKAISAYAVADYWHVFNKQMAECFDKIADFYMERHKIKMSAYQQKIMN